MDNFSLSDSGVTTMSSMNTSGTDTDLTSPKIFDLAVDRYGFDCSVLVQDN